MPILHSIESLEKANIIDTQNRPIIVHASDQYFYYCKYHSGIGTAHRLFKEYLMASFLDCWHFKNTSFCTLQVIGDHIPYDLSIVRNRFDAPCFALRKIQDAFDVNKLTEDILVSSRPKKRLKEDLLRLAFFDIWTCNEDRHANNYNLICQQYQKECILYPIDHEACFNHQNLERGLVSIDLESSLIYSSLFSKLFNVNELKNQQFISNLKQSYYLCYQCCKLGINGFLQNIPLEWNVNLLNKEAELNQYLLNDEWFEECWHTFLTFIQYFTNV